MDHPPTTAPPPVATAPVAVLGECVADAFAAPSPREDRAAALQLEVRPGGGPANTAAALARLGTPTRFLGRISDDAFGRLFHHRLTAAGVDLSAAVPATEHSALAVAELSADGSAAYSFHAQGAADWQWTPDELSAAADGPLSCLHTGSLALVQPPGDAVVERHLTDLRRRATVSVDPNVRPLLVDPSVYRERLPRWCALADVLRLSEEDLRHLYPGTGPREAADLLHRHGPRLVVVTLGEHGVFASLAGEPLHVPAPRVDVVDTVGAGDAFTAGFLHSLHTAGALGGRLTAAEPGDVAEAMAFGARVAAAVCTVRGADLPRDAAQARWSVRGGS